MRFDGRRTIVQRIRVLRRLTLQLALIAQRSGAAIAKESRNINVHDYTTVTTFTVNARLNNV